MSPGRARRSTAPPHFGSIITLPLSVHSSTTQHTLTTSYHTLTSSRSFAQSTSPVHSPQPHTPLWPPLRPASGMNQI